jgi:plastocyanin
MNGTLFYVFGIALVASALGVAFLGLRLENFPGTRLVLAGVIAYFACLVAATTTFAVLNAADEQHKREASQAAEATTAASTSTTTTTSASTTSAGAASTLKLAADPSTIAYDTQQLSAKAGQVTIDFENSSPLTHDVCLDGPSGEIGCSDTISASKTSLSENLKPGSYTFYCSVDSHRQAGMEGTLTVK